MASGRSVLESGMRRRERERERERGDNRSGIKGKAETASDGPMSEMG